jgi:hypothetical protein
MKHKHHIIPKHMGGSDDPSNLIELTPGEHAEAHRLLYEQHGHWQDYVAWQGLAQLDANFDAAKQAIIEGGKKGAAKSNLRWQNSIEKQKQSVRMKEWRTKNPGKTWNGKVYDVTHPDGTVERVEGLRQWCMDRGYNANAFANASLRGNKTHGGFMVKQA